MTTIPTLDEIRAERDPVRRAVLEAILRIVEERPLHISVGRVSNVALAEEAQVKIHFLNQRHKDLRERFKFIRDRYIDPPEPVDEDERFAELLGRIAELESDLAEAVEERNHWKASAHIFVRAMNVQEVDLANRDRTITRLQRRLDEALHRSTDEISARRHRRQIPASDADG